MSFLFAYTCSLLRYFCLITTEEFSFLVVLWLGDCASCRMSDYRNSYLFQGRGFLHVVLAEQRVSSAVYSSRLLATLTHSSVARVQVKICLAPVARLFQSSCSSSIIIFTWRKRQEPVFSRGNFSRLVDVLFDRQIDLGLNHFVGWGTHFHFNFIAAELTALIDYLLFIKRWV